MYSRMLVPLDGSPQAESALPYAIKMANNLKAQLLLLRVVENPPLVNTKPEDRQRNFALAHTYLDSIKLIISNPNRALNIKPEQVETRITEGYPEQEVSFIAIHEKAELIVMTTHGQNGVTRAALGSTASQIIARSKVPVALIQPATNSDWGNLKQTLIEKPKPTSNNSVILTLDGSLKSEVALTTATTLAKQSEATLYLLRIDSPRSTADYGEAVASNGYTFGREIAKENRSRREEAYAYLDKVQDKIIKDGLNCIKAVRISRNPADEIIKFAEEISATALVMATDPRQGVDRPFVGSVADEVMKRSQRPVIMVRIDPRNGGSHERVHEFYPLFRF